MALDDCSDGFSGDAQSNQIGLQIAMQFEQLQDIVYARMVQKVGDRRYWEQWAKDVAIIADRQIERIKYLIDEKGMLVGYFPMSIDPFSELIVSKIN